MTEPRRPGVVISAHLGVILGLSMGAYALTLAAVLIPVGAWYGDSRELWIVAPL